MNIHFKNGGSTNYDTNSIDYIDFTIDEDKPDDPPQENVAERTDFDNIYNLKGQLLENESDSGVYIQNGKKYVMK